ncbi:MAG: TldD/PmbA family protein [Bacteroidetes bacterium]|nr:TldD/PmbA family protein [Bacteroidota bacterium]
MFPQNHSKTVLSFFAFLLCFMGQPLCAQQDRLIDLMSRELDREMQVLKAQDPPAYFLSYRIDESVTSAVSASLGAIKNSHDDHRRLLTVQLRVGDYTMDNTREIRGDDAFDLNFPQFTFIPIDEDEDAIRLVIWNATNQQYRKAAKKYQEVKANTAVKVAAEDQSPDFARDVTPVQHIDPLLKTADLLPDRSIWEKKLKRYSAGFLESEHIFEGDASLRFSAERRRIVTSEGSRIAENRVAVRLLLHATIKCDDGMELPLHRSYFAFDFSGLPSDEEIMADVKEMVATLRAMREAPVIEPYTGPALLSGEAAGVFFHEIFGHRVEGHRQKLESEGQTFKKKEGQSILPSHMSVVFDPSLKSFEGQDLNGYYRFDDEGVKGQKVTVVENGVLRDFIMNRTPFENHPTSNGHGRAQAGYQPVARQSNLIVTTTQPRSDAELRELLLEECRRQGKEFGLLFKDVQGGFTMTGRWQPNSFNVTPTEVHRIYTDGRPDELVRGVDLVGTPLVMFSNITEAGARPAVFTGTCGAESGGVPVTAISPALLVSQIEVQKKSKSQERAPILPRPDRDRDTPQPSKRRF